MAHFIHRLTHDYSYVDGVIAKYWTPDLKKNIHQPYKLWMLIKILEKEKPKKILEFGSGSSVNPHFRVRVLSESSGRDVV
jgi:protein-L-isoaspartate O-methyltransferase